MKIAIASSGKDLNSEISDKGGRAQYYLIFEDGNLIETIKNPFLLGGGAGWSVAYMLSEKGVDKIFIAGDAGEKMKTALDEKGIDFEKTTLKKVRDLIK